MQGFRKSGLHVGRRIEIPAYCDLWMRGARFGTVHSVKDCGDRILAKVRMDHPQARAMAIVNLLDCRLIRIIEGDLQYLSA